MSRSDLLTEAVQTFKVVVGSSPSHAALAPGRVNLIGEHTDYNNGFVLPIAIDRGTVMVGAGRHDSILRISSKNLNDSIQVALDNLTTTTEHSWSNYNKGVAFELRKMGLTLRGADLLINSDVPVASGLSSSAALEMATVHILMALNDISLAPRDIVRICHSAEYDFVGVHCGMMDQFISGLGRKNQVMFLDCQSLAYEHIPIPADCRFVVCDTGVERQLAASEYNKRRQECSEGVHELKAVLPSVESLRDVSVRDFELHKGRLSELIRKRCRHVISENSRVLQSVAALKNQDLSEFGKLMYQSHLSLKNDYEVSCPELDIVVDICAEEEGVYGARMTGAGFGGCAISLVKREFTDALVDRLRTEYPQKTGRRPGVYICTAEDGARHWNLA
jgi:galactokinase